MGANVYDESHSKPSRVRRKRQVDLNYILQPPSDVTNDKRHIGAALSAYKGRFINGKAYDKRAGSAVDLQQTTFDKRHLGSALNVWKYLRRPTGDIVNRNAIYRKRPAFDERSWANPNYLRMYGVGKRHIGSIVRGKSKGFFVTKYRPGHYKYQQLLRKHTGV